MTHANEFSVANQVKKIAINILFGIALVANVGLVLENYFYKVCSTPQALDPTLGAKSQAASFISAITQQQERLWKYNGSAVGLELRDHTRRFYYAQTIPGKAKTGETLFEGAGVGASYSGQIFLYSNDCPTISYPAQGDFNAEETVVTLKGKRPLRNFQCSVIGYSTEELKLALSN